MTSIGDNIKYLNNYLKNEALFVMKVFNRQEKACTASQQPLTQRRVCHSHGFEC